MDFWEIIPLKIRQTYLQKKIRVFPFPFLKKKISLKKATGRARKSYFFPFFEKIISPKNVEKVFFKSSAFLHQFLSNYQIIQNIV
jgi:hypothetical protein